MFIFNVYYVIKFSTNYTYIRWSEIGGQVRMIFCYFIWIRHSIRSRIVTNWIFSPKIPITIHACATCSDLPSNISSMVKRDAAKEFFFVAVKGRASKKK